MCIKFRSTTYIFEYFSFPYSATHTPFTDISYSDDDDMLKQCPANLLVPNLSSLSASLDDLFLSPRRRSKHPPNDTVPPPLPLKKRLSSVENPFGSLELASSLQPQEPTNPFLARAPANRSEKTSSNGGSPPKPAPFNCQSDRVALLSAIKCIMYQPINCIYVPANVLYKIIRP